MSACPEKYRRPECPPSFESVGVLVAHMVTEHLVSSSTAFPEARAAFGKDVQAPTPVRPAAPKPARPVAVVADARQDSATDSAPRNPAPPALPNPPASKEIPMATHSHRSDPTACKLCARLTKKAGAPTKCKWHGGGGRSTSNRGKGPKTATGGGTRRPAKPEPAVASNGTGKTTAYIRGLVQSVAAGKAAEVELASIREALGG